MLLPILALLTLTGPAGAHSRQNEITLVATVNAVALVASARCPDILVNTEISQLEGALQLADADRKETFALTMVFSKEFGRQIGRSGAHAWCDDVYARFGPDGTMMKGLLQR